MTGAEEYDFCAIFLDGTDRSSATELVASTFAVVAERHVVRVGDTVFYVRRNPDAGLASGFIGWPVKIDVEPDEPTRALVDTVSTALTAAWSAGYRALAACDFEDELPDLGGRRFRT